MPLKSQRIYLTRDFSVTPVARPILSHFWIMSCNSFQCTFNVRFCAGCGVRYVGWQQCVWLFKILRLAALYMVI